MSQGKLLYIGNELSNNGITVTSIETLGLFLENEGFKVYRASSIKNKWLRLLDMLWTTIKHSRSVSAVLIDTYSTQNFYFAVAVANLCRLLRLPYIPILRGGNLPDRIQKSKSASYKLFNGAKTNVAPSQYLMQAFAAERYDKLTYIPNSIETDAYPFLLRKKIRPKLLWVRSFAEIYNPMLALLVLEKLMKTRPEASLCMIGPDKDGSLQKCRAYAEEHELSVSFTGKLSKEAWRNKSRYFDIFINTTNFDNTPVSVIEAMALGLPVISTSVGGVPFLIDDHKDGLLVPQNNAESFVAAVDTLCTASDLAQTLSINARKKAEGFDWQNVKQEWLALLKQ